MKELSQRVAITNLKTHFQFLESRINNMKKVSTGLQNSQDTAERRRGSTVNHTVNFIDKEFISFKEVFEKTLKELEEKQHA